MIVKLTHRDVTVIISANADRTFVKNIINAVEWVLFTYEFTHMNNDIDALLKELRVKIPDLTAADAVRIKSALDTIMTPQRMFVEICNILAKGNIFSEIEYLSFDL